MTHEKFINSLHHKKGRLKSALDELLFWSPGCVVVRYLAGTAGAAGA
ncbi:MAG: hypothetical protein BMS9Abin15_0419 [Gammaproteobacteria bacterium]|nr:MAG: hypothetical protein BMS9Abin15_0419 [Gammaproteobacteria bacterium]